MTKAKNLRDAFVFIEENIDRSINVEDVSRVSGYSIPQLYRLFKRLTGDTINEYIIRRKLSEAVNDLNDSSKTVGEIAFQYGFGSHDVFTRAFNRVYGITPNNYRRIGMKLQPIKTVSIQKNDPKDQDEHVLYRICELSSFDVIGIECEACMWDSDGAIGKLWIKFTNKYHESDHKIGAVTMYGICEHETCRGQHFKYMAGVKISDIRNSIAGMITRSIPKQKYLQASIPKQISTPDAYTGVEYYAKSLGYQIDTCDQIEEYDRNYQDPETHTFKLYIPIK